VKVVGEAKDGREALRMVKEAQTRFDLDGRRNARIKRLEATARVSKEFPDVRGHHTLDVRE